MLQPCNKAPADRRASERSRGGPASSPQSRSRRFRKERRHRRGPGCRYGFRSRRLEARRRTWTYSIRSWSVATGSIRMDKVEQLFERFRARTNSSAASKLDVLLDLDRLTDPRLVPFLLHVLADTTQP